MNDLIDSKAFAPVPIETVNDQHLVVNRATPRDTNVVISWTDDDGMRQATGMAPAEALKMADALIAAAYAVGGLTVRVVARR